MTVCEIPWRTPFAAFSLLEGEADAHLLHGGDRGRSGWSIIVADPVEIVALNDGEEPGEWLKRFGEIAALRRLQGGDEVAAPFISGLVGYVGYEALAGLEPSLSLPPSPYDFPLARFGAYDAAALFNRFEKRAFISGRSEGAIAQLERRLGEAELEDTLRPVFTGLTSNFEKQSYERAVETVMEQIRNGDFYQANIAQTLKVSAADKLSPLRFFREIASGSDAFFSALLQCDAGAIISNSPERFFRLSTNGCVTAEPVKGTRPRGANEAEDEALARELLADEKDRAENIMIADLMRNDLSRICEDHSIREEAICELMTLSRVHHLVSRISGKLRSDVDIGSVFSALFPCGSITGAPKIEAMRAIGEIEQVGRGPYCGAIGYIDDRGGADFAVAIRTMMMSRDRMEVVVPVGGGVTLRSDPQSEYEETLVKARSALPALAAFMEPPL